MACFSEGHILLEDVPGVAKTMLARALAGSVGAAFKRVQCTPDLLPTDITGASIFNPKTTEFEFRPGPIFAQIVLADEINRATPRTQAALLEAMAERRVSVDGTTYDSEAAVPGHRDPEPDRPRGDLSASRGPARPVPGAAQPRLSDAEQEVTMLEVLRAADRPLTNWRRSSRPTRWSPASRRCGRSTSTKRSAAT